MFHGMTYQRRLGESKVSAMLLLSLLGLFVHGAHAQVTSTWNGTSGNWSDATRWSTNPVFPNNGNGGNDFNAVVGSGSLTVNQSITIEDLTFNGGTITGTSPLTIQDTLSWTAGTFSGTGTTTINNGTISSLSAKSLNQRTLEILGMVELAEGPINSSSRGTISVKDGATFVANGSHVGVRGLNTNLVINPGGTFINKGGQGTEIPNLVNNGTVEVTEQSAIFPAAGSGDGDLILRPNSGAIFELQDIDDYQFTGRIILDDGVFDILLFDGSGITFVLPSLLSGNGTYNGFGGVLVNSTEIAPGFSVGHIDIDANYEQTSEGKLTIEVEDSTTFDTVAITGGAMLGGSIEVVVANESLLPPGTMIEVLTAGNLMGTEFDDVTTTGGNDIFLAPIYSADRVTLFSYADGDMDRLEDGVTTADVAAFAMALTDPVLYRANFGISAIAAGDLDDDGDIDVDDIDDFADAVGMSLAALHEYIQAYSTQVPEPGALMLALLGMIGGMTRRPERVLRVPAE